MPSMNQILTQNDHSRSLAVIRFSINEEPLMGYIVQYNNNVALNVKVQEIYQAKEAKIAIYDDPTLV